jgi:hypothetical protein
VVGFDSGCGEGLRVAEWRMRGVCRMGCRGWKASGRSGFGR